MKRTLKPIAIIVGAAVVVPLTFMCLTPIAESKSKPKSKTIDGAGIFKQNCASCHVAGGNTIKPNKPVAGSAKLNSLITFRDYLRSPIGHMPYYKHVVTNKKTLEALYKYCKSLPASEQS
jgi:mono/diheme cytochrome c family protein